MEIKTEVIGDVTILTLMGDHLDAGNTKQFKNDINRLLTDASKVVFDLHAVKFVDSSGLGAFLTSFRRVSEKGGDMKFCNLTSSVRILFEIVRMHRIFEIYNNMEEALSSFVK
jgi:anti-sigma B factor antagonist